MCWSTQLYKQSNLQQDGYDNLCDHDISEGPKDDQGKLCNKVIFTVFFHLDTKHTHTHTYTLEYHLQSLCIWDRKYNVNFEGLSWNEHTKVFLILSPNFLSVKEAFDEELSLRWKN